MSLLYNCYLSLLYQHHIICHHEYHNNTRNIIVQLIHHDHHHPAHHLAHHSSSLSHHPSPSTSIIILFLFIHYAGVHKIRYLHYHRTHDDAAAAVHPLRLHGSNHAAPSSGTIVVETVRKSP